MLSFSIKRTVNHIPNLRKRLKDLNKQSVSVGYFPANGVHAPAKMTYANLFAIMSFGSSKKNIPARPILDLTFALYNPLTTNTDVKKYLKKYFSNISKKTPPMKISKLLDNIGGDYVQKTRMGFGDTSKLVSNSSNTIARKGGRDTPLIDTGALRANLSYITSFNGNLVT
jgi:hypothetical protein